MSILPKWFSNDIKPNNYFHPIKSNNSDKPNIYFRRDYYICTKCGFQSCGGIYSSVCRKCDGIQSDPPRDVRSDYLCNDCARKRSTCKCDYPKYKEVLVPPPSPKVKQPDPCCCYCNWCNYLCKCRCCCLTCICRSSSCRYCCSSKWDCSCCTCFWSWCGCSNASILE